MDILMIGEDEMESLTEKAGWARFDFNAELEILAERRTKLDRQRDELNADSGGKLDAMMNYLKSAIAFTLKKMIVIPMPAKFGEVKTFDDIAKTATVVFNRTFGELFEMIDLAELKH